MFTYASNLTGSLLIVVALKTLGHLSFPTLSFFSIVLRF